MADPVLTPANLSAINLLTEQAWSDNQANVIATTTEDNTLEALVAHQRSLSQNAIQYLRDPNKDYDVNILWYNFCAGLAVDCDQDPCDVIEGVGNDILSQSLAIAQCAEDSFEVSESLFAGTSLDLQAYIVQRQNFAIKNILEYINQKGIAFLAASADTAIEIPESAFDTSVIAQMMLDAQKKSISNPFMIDGGNLFLPFTNAQFNAQNAEGRGQAEMARQYDLTYDIPGFAKASMSDTTFLITPQSYAFLNKNYLQNRTPVYDGTMDKLKYSIPVPGYNMSIDVWHQRVCEDGTKDRFKHVFLYKAHFDFVLNPYCAGKSTGILEYTKVPDPTPDPPENGDNGDNG